MERLFVCMGNHSRPRSHSLNSRARAPPANRREKGYGGENGAWRESAFLVPTQSFWGRNCAYERVSRHAREHSRTNQQARTLTPRTKKILDYNFRKIAFNRSTKARSSIKHLSFVVITSCHFREWNKTSSDRESASVQAWNSFFLWQITISVFFSVQV